jgi:uncharacterized protein (TIGR03085 family)
VLVSQVMHFVDPSREVLAETLLAAGPDSPTLCEGWLTRDLAAHLYLRERKAAVGIGLLIKSLARASDKATAKLASKLKTTEDYAELVNTFRSGPPALSPLKIKALDESSNLIEYFVHTEDIRRAGDRWAPRALDEEYSDALWDELIKRAAILYRGVDLGIVLVRPTGPRHVAKRAPVSWANLVNSSCMPMAERITPWSPSKASRTPSRCSSPPKSASDPRLNPTDSQLLSL